MTQLTLQDFEPLIDETFHLVVSQEERLELRVAEVNPGSERIRAQYEDGARAPFSIVFRAGPDVALPQRLYRLENETLGAHDIFLVPIGPDKQGMLYEAVFG